LSKNIRECSKKDIIKIYGCSLKPSASECKIKTRTCSSDLKYYNSLKLSEQLVIKKKQVRLPMVKRKSLFDRVDDYIKRHDKLPH